MEIRKIRNLRILIWTAFGSLLAPGLLAPGVVEGVQARQAEAQPRIVVSPDYLVSRDGDRPHVEIMAAANPRNARLLTHPLAPSGGAFQLERRRIRAVCNLESGIGGPPQTTPRNMVRNVERQSA